MKQGTALRSTEASTDLYTVVTQTLASQAHRFLWQLKADCNSGSFVSDVEMAHDEVRLDSLKTLCSNTG